MMFLRKFSCFVQKILVKYLHTTQNYRIFAQKLKKCANGNNANSLVQ